MSVCQSQARVTFREMADNNGENQHVDVHQDDLDIDLPVLIPLSEPVDEIEQQHLQDMQRKNNEEGGSGEHGDPDRQQGDNHQQDLIRLDDGQQQPVGSGPTLPPKNFKEPTPPRPEAGHPGGEPTQEFLILANKCVTARGEFQAARIRAYDHINMDAPKVTVRPNVTKEDLGKT